MKTPAGLAPIGLFWKHRGRRACTRAHTHIWLISSKLKHFVRGVNSRYTHARSRRLNLGSERDTYSEGGYISPFSISPLSNYILVSSKKWRRAASRQLPGNLQGCTGPPLKIKGTKSYIYFSHITTCLFACVFFWHIIHSHSFGTIDSNFDQKRSCQLYFGKTDLEIARWISDLFLALVSFNINIITSGNNALTSILFRDTFKLS